MKRNTRILVALLMAESLTVTPLLQAQETESYGDIVGRKLATSLSNLSTATLEIPKNIIIDSNQSNIVYGVFGGIFEGVVQTMGRVSTGIWDLATAPIPTQPIVYPPYVWQNFDTKTTYGPLLRMENTDDRQ